LFLWQALAIHLHKIVSGVRYLEPKIILWISEASISIPDSKSKHKHHLLKSEVSDPADNYPRYYFSKGLKLEAKNSFTYPYQRSNFYLFTGVIHYVFQSYSLFILVVCSNADL
jgi:hypothetical protein